MIEGVERGVANILKQDQVALRMLPLLHQNWRGRLAAICQTIMCSLCKIFYRIKVSALSEVLYLLEDLYANMHKQN